MVISIQIKSKEEEKIKTYRICQFSLLYDTSFIKWTLIFQSLWFWVLKDDERLKRF